MLGYHIRWWNKAGVYFVSCIRLIVLRVGSILVFVVCCFCLFVFFFFSITRWWIKLLKAVYINEYVSGVNAPGGSNVRVWGCRTVWWELGLDSSTAMRSDASSSRWPRHSLFVSASSSTSSSVQFATTPTDWPKDSRRHVVGYRRRPASLRLVRQD